jgi:hypothetical protein
MGGLFKKKKAASQAAPTAPAFTPSTVMDGDRVVSKTYQDPSGAIVTQNFNTADEQQRKALANPRVNELLSTLGQTPEVLAKQYDQMGNDYATQQRTLFARDYNRSVENLQTNIASRFGTLKATPFLEDLKKLEGEVRSPAYQEINRNASLYRTDLGNQDLSRRLQELSALGYQLSNDQQKFLSGIQAPLSSSQLINNFNQNQYTQKLQQYQNDLAQRSSNTNSFLGFLGRAI